MRYPFLSEPFLDALEASGSVGPGTGWQPCHLRQESAGKLQALLPLYSKTHSFGEYVFDWSWASAYRRNGLAYYPKLVSAIPFTPATGPRVLFGADADQSRLCPDLLDQVIDRARQVRASGWHLLFPDQDLLDRFQDSRLQHRQGVQFHWFNRGYADFDAFLGTLSSRKRKMLRRERRRVAEQGVTITMLEGPAISPLLWDFFYQLYQDTYRKRSGSGGYLKPAFFHRIGEFLGRQVLMAVAYHGGEPLACSLFFRDDRCLYGRYWGCRQELDCLHFELCYYQGIDYAIARGLQRFDAGAQGEHKILRGFEPVRTHSLHWLADPGFARAVGRFLEEERLQIEEYISQARALLPYRAEISPV